MPNILAIGKFLLFQTLISYISTEDTTSSKFVPIYGIYVNRLNFIEDFFDLPSSDRYN
jgi:hypothetical protein